MKLKKEDETTLGRTYEGKEENLVALIKKEINKERKKKQKKERGEEEGEEKTRRNKISNDEETENIARYNKVYFS